MEAGGAAYQLYVGIDVAAATFVAAWLAPGGKLGTPVTGEQTAAGFAALQRRLRATGSLSSATLVVLDATGNYVRRFTAVLAEKSIQPREGRVLCGSGAT